MASTSESISPARPIGILRGWLSSQRNFKRFQQVIIFIIMGLGAIAMIAPFEWMLATSFSRSANVAMPRIPRFWRQVAVGIDGVDVERKAVSGRLEAL